MTEDFMATIGDNQLSRKDLPGVVYVTAILGIAISSFIGAILLTGHPIASRIPVLVLPPPNGAIYNWFLSLLAFGMSVFFFFIKSYVTNRLNISVTGVSLVAAVVITPLLFGLWSGVFLVPLFVVLGLCGK